MTQPDRHAHSQPGANVGTAARKLLRQHLLQQRRALDAGLRHQWDARIADKLLDWCRARQPASMGVYWPIHGEPDLMGAYARIAGMGVQLALPLVVEKQAPLAFLAWQPGDDMVADSYGIPTPAQRHRLITPQVLLIPCVGFNASGHRLGYGGGFYDRTLAMPSCPHTIGVAYQQAACEFAADSHDVAMDVILTEA